MKIERLIIFLIFGSFFPPMFGQTLEWKFMPQGSSIENCSSQSDCDNNIQCYALKYYPSYSGTVTSYTLGFLGTCPGEYDYYMNNLSASCTMTDNSTFISDCSESNAFFLAASGNTGNINVTAGTPIALHQICFSIGESETINLVEESITQLTVSIDSLGNNQALNDVLSFQDLELDNSDCHYNCGENDECSISFVLPESLIKVDTLLGGSIVNGLSSENGTLLGQAFDIVDESNRDCRIAGGSEDIILDFKLYETSDIYGNGIIDLLGGERYKIKQTTEGFAGEIPFNQDAYSSSSIGDLRAYQIDVSFADHLQIVADQLSVDLASMNSEASVFESAIISFRDENGSFYDESAYSGYYSSFPDLSGNCLPTYPDTAVYLNIGAGSFAFQDTFTVNVLNPCSTVPGSPGTNDTFTVNARLHAGLDSADIITGFRLIVTAEDVSSQEELDDGSGEAPDDGIPGNHPSNINTSVLSFLRGIVISDCIFSDISLANNWISLDVSKIQDGNNLISFSYSKNEETSHFEIEWGRDAKIFQPISMLSDIDNETFYQHYVHENPIKGVNYYRVKRVFKDGDFKYSRIVSSINAETTGSGEYYCFPNPAGSSLFLSHPDEDHQEVFVTCFTMTGQKIFKKSMHLSYDPKIDISFFEKGWYTLLISDGVTNKTLRFLKK